MEQIIKRFLIDVPDPDLSAGQYAIGVTLMLPFILLAIMWFAKAVAPVSPIAGKWIADRSILATVLLGVAIFLFIT